MNLKLTILAVTAALLSVPALQAQAGVDEPSTVRDVRRTISSTALDDDSVRPLERSRKPVPAIEHDVVLPEPRRVKHGRDADSEVVRPNATVFRPERSLDDGLTTTKKPVSVKPQKITTQPKAAPLAAVDGRHRSASEDPVGRANESGRSSREGKPER
jgi:hypothetical protein